MAQNVKNLPAMQETIIEKDMCASVFTAALFTIARTWTQPRCPSMDEWIQKLWHICTMEYYSAIKKKAFESVLRRSMNLEPMVQSEVKSEIKRQILHINACVWNLERWC